MTRLTAGLWVDAFLWRLHRDAISAYVVARGDATAGAVLIKLCPGDGTASLHQRVTALDGSRPWHLLAEGPEVEMDAMARRERERDPDLWLIDVDAPDGAAVLEAPGLD